MFSFKIASFNTLNLVRPGVYFYDDEPFLVPNGPDDASNEYIEKIQWIGNKLDEIDADIVGFQEVFSEDALRDALQRSKRFSSAEFYAPHTSKELNETVDESGKIRARGPRLAIASRFPIKKLDSISNFPIDFKFSVPWEDFDSNVISAYGIGISKFQRPILRAIIEIRKDVEIVVFVAHLKSKRGTFFGQQIGSNPKENSKDDATKALGSARSLVQRAVEATALRHLMLDDLTRSPAVPVVLLGDLNDELDSVTTSIIRGTRPFPRQYQKLMDKPEIWANINRPRWDKYLYSAHEIQASQSNRNVLYSHIFDSNYSVLDHILVSQELVSANPLAIGELSYLHVYNDHTYDSMLTKFQSKQRVQSDHGIPVAEVFLKDPTQEDAALTLTLTRQA